MGSVRGNSVVIGLQRSPMVKAVGVLLRLPSAEVQKRSPSFRLQVVDTYVYFPLSITLFWSLVRGHESGFHAGDRVLLGPCATRQASRKGRLGEERRKERQSVS